MSSAYSSLLLKLTLVLFISLIQLFFYFKISVCFSDLNLLTEFLTLIMNNFPNYIELYVLFSYISLSFLDCYSELFFKQFVGFLFLRWITRELFCSVEHHVTLFFHISEYLHIWKIKSISQFIDFHSKRLSLPSEFYGGSWVGYIDFGFKVGEIV
jgi:hypothetical protein